MLDDTLQHLAENVREFTETVISQNPTVPAACASHARHVCAGLHNFCRYKQSHPLGFCLC